MATLLSLMYSYQPNKKKPERSNLTDDRGHGKLALLEQIGLIAAQIIRCELVRRLSEVLGESRYRSQVTARCTIGIITTLDSSSILLRKWITGKLSL